MFSKHNGITLEINKRKEWGKFLNVWELNNSLLNNQWVEKKSQRKLENPLRWIKTKIQYTKTYGIQWREYLEGNLYRICFYFTYIVSWCLFTSQEIHKLNKLSVFYQWVTFILKNIWNYTYLTQFLFRMRGRGKYPSCYIKKIESYTISFGYNIRN